MEDRDGSFRDEGEERMCRVARAIETGNGVLQWEESQGAKLLTGEDQGTEDREDVRRLVGAPF